MVSQCQERLPKWRVSKGSAWFCDVLGSLWRRQFGGSWRYKPCHSCRWPQALGTEMTYIFNGGGLYFEGRKTSGRHVVIWCYMSCPLSTRCSTNVILLRSLLGELMNWSWLESKHAGPSCVVPDVESPLTLVPWLVAIVLPKRHIMFSIKHETSQMVSRYWGSNPLKLQLTLAYIYSGNRCCTSLNCTNGHAEFVEKWQDSARKTVVIALPEPSHNSPHKLWSGSPPPCRRVAESQYRWGAWFADIV